MIPLGRLAFGRFEQGIPGVTEADPGQRAGFLFDALARAGGWCFQPVGRLQVIFLLQGQREAVRRTGPTLAVVGAGDDLLVEPDVAGEAVIAEYPGIGGEPGIHVQLLGGIDTLAVAPGTAPLVDGLAGEQVRDVLVVNQSE